MRSASRCSPACWASRCSGCSSPRCSTFSCAVRPRIARRPTPRCGCPPRRLPMSDSDVKRGAALAGLCAVIVLLAVAAALAGCAVGPNYVKPATPVAAAFAGASDAPYGTDEAQAKFWTQFGDPTLNQLVDEDRKSVV